MKDLARLRLVKSEKCAGKIYIHVIAGHTVSKYILSKQVEYTKAMS
jgi:hypothetical protein